MGRRLRVRVPATTANLGSGFDCVGMAFDWYDELELELGADGLEVEVTGEGAADVPRDERDKLSADLNQLSVSLGKLQPAIGMN